MEKLFKKHPEALLVALSIFFMAIVIVAYVLGMRAVFASVSRAINPGDAGSGSVEFDLSGAANLDLKGIVH